MSTVDLSLSHNPSQRGATEISRCLGISTSSAKYLLYSLVPLSTDEAKEIMAEIFNSYYKYIDEQPEENDEQFMRLAPRLDFSGHSLQDVFDYHMELGKERVDSGGNSDGGVGVYPFGFVVVSHSHWRKDGLVIVACEEIHDYTPSFQEGRDMNEAEGEWWADRGRFKIENVGPVVTIAWRDSELSGAEK